MLLNCFFFWMIVLNGVGDLIGKNYLKVHFWRVFISKARRSQASESPKSVVCVFVILYTRFCNRKNSQKHQPSNQPFLLFTKKMIFLLRCNCFWRFRRNRCFFWFRNELMKMRKCFCRVCKTRCFFWFMDVTDKNMDDSHIMNWKQVNNHLEVYLQVSI